MHAKDWLLVFVSFFLPPIPVLIKSGLWSSDCK
ncbi:CYFA0S06e04346g1_1 [Cyberlindnera fabianii]|uniref:CYFA0S06e04346g1_1 n=1 Tax=Cyberlindnera fabianii TaxID=36022 RepID=A0A061B0Q3_CYBFA|nr:CYFA0S06e04346g1_1 [Cyberlindnera fabianii]